MPASFSSSYDAGEFFKTKLITVDFHTPKLLILVFSMKVYVFPEAKTFHRSQGQNIFFLFPIPSSCAACERARLSSRAEICCEHDSEQAGTVGLSWVQTPPSGYKCSCSTLIQGFWCNKHVPGRCCPPAVFTCCVYTVNMDSVHLKHASITQRLLSVCVFLFCGG